MRLRDTIKQRRIRRQRIQGTLMILAALIVIVAMTVSVPARPARDPCNAPPSLLDRCVASSECKLNAHELMKWTDYQDMLDSMCD